MIKILLYAIIGCLSLSCQTSEPLVVTPVDSIPPKKYLALGDSYTIGQSVEDPLRYPNQLVDQLAMKGVELDSVRIIAKTGWRTDQLQVAIEMAQLENEYDLVSLLIGVNNQFQGRPIDTYKKEFLELLEKSIELAKGDKDKVFVLSIPDYKFTPFGQNSSASISTAIDEFNEVNRTITASKGVSYFDITPISREGIIRPALVASDGLHPSGEMYKEWVNLIFDDVLLKVN